jgi:hypothetical protein
MKLENQVNSLVLSKQLSDLGVKQESLFYWHIMAGADFKLISKKELDQCLVFRVVQEYYSAFTVSELGEMLLKYKVLAGICYLRTEGKWSFIYEDRNTGDDIEVFAETEADARAKMLIYLIENKLI